MKLSMARVSVSAWTCQTCSRMSAREMIWPWFGEVAEQVGFHDGEVGDAVGGDEFEGGEVDGAVVELKWRGLPRRQPDFRLRLVPPEAAQQGLDADDEDVEVEGLGEIVVGAGFQAFEDVFGPGAGGEHENGGEVLACAQFGDYVESVVAGEHQSRTMPSVFSGGASARAVSPSAFVAASIALGLQVIEQPLREVLFVFDEGDERGLAHRDDSTLLRRGRRGGG